MLLIDDEQECLESLGVMLSHLGYRVIALLDTRNALAVVLRKGTTIDLVITDYSMPEINGLEFLNLLKRMLSSVPLIMLTGYGDVGTYFKALSIGVSEFVSKPVGLEELDRIINTALAQKEVLIRGHNIMAPIMHRKELKPFLNDQHKQCRFISGKYMVSCGRNRDVYVPSSVELRDYCESPMHTLCRRYQQDDREQNADAQIQGYGTSARNPNSDVRELGKEKKNA